MGFSRVAASAILQRSHPNRVHAGPTFIYSGGEPSSPLLFPTPAPPLPPPPLPYPPPPPPPLPPPPPSPPSRRPLAGKWYLGSPSPQLYGVAWRPSLSPPSPPPPPPMRGDVERVFISQDRIALRVHELARQITDDHRQVASSDGDGELTIVPILTGAMIFSADLIRHIPMAMQIGLLDRHAATPARSAAHAGLAGHRRKGRRPRGPPRPARRRHPRQRRDDRLVASMLKAIGGRRRPHLCAAPQGPPQCPRSAGRITSGFEIPDEFVVGYGLDFNNYYPKLAGYRYAEARSDRGRKRDRRGRQLHPPPRVRPRRRRRTVAAVARKCLVRSAAPVLH